MTLLNYYQQNTGVPLFYSNFKKVENVTIHKQTDDKDVLTF